MNTQRPGKVKGDGKQTKIGTWWGGTVTSIPALWWQLYLHTPLQFTLPLLYTVPLRPDCNRTECFVGSSAS